MFPNSEGFPPASDAHYWGCPASWIERKAALAEILSIHCCTLAQLFWLGWFGTCQALHRVIHAMHTVRVVGTLRGINGRPCNVYYRGNVSSRLLRHNVGMNRFLLPFGNCVTRDADERFLSDATLSLAHPYQVEWDCGEETLRQVQHRLALYRGTDALVLFVTPSESRVRHVKGLLGGLEDNVLLTTTQQAIDDPWGEIWEDAFGNTTAVEIPREKAGQKHRSRSSSAASATV